MARVVHFEISADDPQRAVDFYARVFDWRSEKWDGPQDYCADVAQVYVGDTHAKVPRPAKELKGFAKVSLRPGETKRVSVRLDRRALSYYDAEGRRWRADPGDFDVLVGRSSAQIELRGKLSLAASEAADSK